MNAFTKLKAHDSAISIFPLTLDQLPTWLLKQEKHLQKWVNNAQFKAESGTVCLIPDAAGGIASVLLGLADANDFWAFGALPAKLPAGNYIITDATKLLKTALHFELAALGWALGFYQFTAYKAALMPRVAKLVLPKSIDEKAVLPFVESISLARDLINTPAEDMGPEELEKAVKTVAKKWDASVSVIKGDQLLKHNYRVIHTVGRASPREPRMIDLRWGPKKASSKTQKITLIGKGVCFDSGGLDLKTSSGMLLMKKDMAGAAMMLALAQLIMAYKLPVQLRLLIGAVDNAVSGNAYRPGDIIKTRSGKTVEVTNTDAEGRLVLCDLITEACTEKPDFLINFATLTGAARVALGEDLPAMFSNTQTFANDLFKAGQKVNDPIWQMPLPQNQREKLKSEIADMTNCADSPYGGAITAALFLQAFVEEGITWAHFDTCAWQARAKPGRPAGADVFAVRAVFEALSCNLK